MGHIVPDLRCLLLLQYYYYSCQHDFLDLEKNDWVVGWLVGGGGASFPPVTDLIMAINGEFPVLFKLRQACNYKSYTNDARGKYVHYACVHACVRHE